MASIGKDILKRIYLIYFLLMVVALAIPARIIYIQSALGEELKATSEARILQYQDIEENRGSIYAADGSLLSTSVPVFEIRLDMSPVVVPDEVFFGSVDSLSRNLARLFRDKPASHYRQVLTQARKEGDRYFLLKKNVTYPQYKQLRTFPILRKGRFGGGMITIPGQVRQKPFELLASRTIGFQRDSIRVGLEGAYHDELEGICGRRLMRRIANNVWVPVNEENEIEPQDGNDIVTSIDIHIQDVAEHSLMQHLLAHDADHGCAVLMEVETGFVVAIANLERVDTGRYEERYNYAIGESSDPGSTFKLPVLMVAIEDGVVRLSDSVDTEGGQKRFYSQVMRDSRIGGYGTITLQRAFEVSSNVAISKVIHQHYQKQPEKFIAGLERMSLSKKLGLELPGEGTPRINQPGMSTWTDFYSIPWMSVGYEVNLTPLQVLTFYNAVANQGRMVKPLFVREVRRGNQTIRKIEPQVINPAIASKATLQQAQTLLEGVVLHGTATELAKAPYRIAGKTGTAQKRQVEGRYTKDAHIASFVGYFPADDPKYSCIVVINSPRKGAFYGSAVAAPVFREIADKVFATHLDLQQRKDSLPPSSGSFPIAHGGHAASYAAICGHLGVAPRLTEASATWVVPVQQEDGWVYGPRVVREDEVPDVVGMNVRDAVYLLEKMGLKVDLRGFGRVSTQSLQAGSPLVRGNKITLELSAS